MYDNIGGKIKGLAKTMFIVEAIGAVIMGIVLLATDDDLIFAGLLTLFCGPIIAWVSSWVLYAFGELVEDIHAMRNKHYPIAEEQANLETEEKAKQKEETTRNSPTKKAQKYINHGIAPEYVGDGYTCPVCKMSMDVLIPCEKCGYIPPQND